MGKLRGRYRLAPGFSLVTTADACVVVGAGAPPFVLSPLDAAALSDLHALLAEAVDAATLERAAPPGSNARTLLDRLLHERLVTTVANPRPGPSRGRRRAARPRLCEHLVVGICGAIQAVFAPTYLVPLLEACERVDAIVTRGGARMIRPRVLEHFGARVWTDAFTTRDGLTVPHAQLARSAGAVLVVPASAHALHRLASGACSDLLSLVVASTRAPVIVAPSMSWAMWQHAPVRRNIELLRRDGVYVIEPRPAPSMSARKEGGSAAGLGVDSDELVRVVAAVLARAVRPRTA